MKPECATTACHVEIDDKSFSKYCGQCFSEVLRHRAAFPPQPTPDHTLPSGLPTGGFGGEPHNIPPVLKITETKYPDVMTPLAIHIIEAMPCECRGLTGYERNVLMMSGYTCNRCAKLKELQDGN